MIDDQTGTFTARQFNFVPYASGGGMRLYQEEEVHDAYVILYGTTPKDQRRPESKNAIALVTVVGFVQSVFGYPNEESFWKDPRGHLGRRFFEVVGSSGRIMSTTITNGRTRRGSSVMQAAQYATWSAAC